MNIFVPLLLCLVLGTQNVVSSCLMFGGLVSNKYSTSSLFLLSSWPPSKIGLPDYDGKNHRMLVSCKENCTPRYIPHLRAQSLHSPGHQGRGTKHRNMCLHHAGGGHASLSSQHSCSTGQNTRQHSAYSNLPSDLARN